ncbi:MAG: LPS assembly lipoprotein LptE [Paracoccus sp. (in: a-proteobacteria)]|nr:LPS assembly lipoprotein LptE [Paracoccus sp. (in: a-proteobacteria)]
MSSPDLTRRGLLAALGATLALAACGLTPAYGPSGAGALLHDRVSLRAPDDTDSFAFNRRLTERLGTGTAPAFDLDYRLRIARVAQAITSAEVATRYSLNGTADFVLTDRASGRVITQNQVSAFTSYGATGTTIATLAAERDAHERLMRMLADQLVTHMLAADLGAGAGRA